MSGGMAFFVLNDALVKHASAALPAWQIIFVRGMLATALLLSAAWWTGALSCLRAAMDRRVGARACLDAAATFAYLTSLFHLPIGLATAINMASPIVMLVLTVLLMGERPPLHRWLAVGLGFAGVICIMQPTPEGINPYAMLCLMATLLHAGRDLVTRRIDRAIPSILVTVGTSAAVTLLAGLWGMFKAWQPMTWPQAGGLATASGFLAAGYFLVTVSMRGGEMSVIASFRFTALLFALLLGYLLWGELPDALAWSGVVLLVLSGLWLLRPVRNAQK